MGVTLSTKVKKPTDYTNHFGEAPEIHGKPGVATVSMNKKDGTFAHHEEVVHKGVATTVKPAMVTVGGRRTVQTAPYESAQLYVELTMPSDPGDINATYEFVSDWVSSRLAQAIKESF